eukprot:RCo016908
MNVVQEIRRINSKELNLGLDGSRNQSWHNEYKSSAYIFIGGLPYTLTEGDVLCVFSQYGEPSDIHLVRDKATGKSKGFCFLAYEDQRSTVLAVDNLNGAKLAGRTLRVDHVKEYKPPEEKEGNEPRLTLAEVQKKEDDELRAKMKKEFKERRKQEKRQRPERHHRHRHRSDDPAHPSRSSSESSGSSGRSGHNGRKRQRGKTPPKAQGMQREAARPVSAAPAP